MKEQEYEALREQREKLKGYLKGPLTPTMKGIVNQQLNNIRTILKGAHKNEYKTRTGQSTKRV